LEGRFLSKYTRIILLMVIDSVLIAGSIYMSYLLRFDFNIIPYYSGTLEYVIPLYVVLTISAFYIFKIYKRVWQYASIGDLISILKGVVVGAVAFYIIHRYAVSYYYPNIVVPRSVYIISILISLFAVGGSRFIWRIARDNYRKIHPAQRRALIVGAGEAGIMVVRELKHSQSESYPVAFIDDDHQKQKLEVVGIPVVGKRADIHKAVERYQVDDIIIALPSASRMEITKIINLCKETSCQIKIIPKVNDLINGKIKVNMIRDVSVEDLLGREPIDLDILSISDYLSDRIVLVTGAGGSIGSELSRQIAQFNPKKLLLLGHGENSIYDIELELKKRYAELTIIPIIADVQDRRRLENIFKQYKPQVIFHAAAHKHVPMMERNPLEAIKNNILGTYHVAECAHVTGAERFVMISTDKAVNPTNVMGATKRAAEMIVQSLNEISKTRFSSVRFGNVLGSRGSVIPVFKRQIEEGGPVTVTHPEMIRYFMTIPEAVQLVIQTGAIASGGEVFILDMGQPVKIVELARDLIRLSGLEPDKDIRIVYTGIRPGEKLFEELLTSEEGAQGTKYDRIYIGKASTVPNELIIQMQKQFEYMALKHEQSSSDEIKKLLKKWIPTYNHEPSSIKKTNPAEDEAFLASLEIVAAIEDR